MSKDLPSVIYLPTPEVDWNKSYADLLRGAMRSKRNLAGAAMSIRDLAAGTLYSYEHVRKVLAGEPVVSRKFSDAAAELLQLNPRALWDKAKREKLAKAAKRLGVSGLNAEFSLDRQLVSLWTLLPTEDRAQVVRFAERLAKANMVLGELMHPDTTPEPADELMHPDPTSELAKTRDRNARAVRGKAAKRRPRPTKA